MTSPRTPTTLAELRALAEQMSRNPADAIALASQLQTLARNLPPDRAELLSRVQFARASLWTYVASFELVQANENNEVGPQIIRLNRDLWVRGVSAQSIIQYNVDPGDLELGVSATLPSSETPNNRWTFDVNWRVDARQGFVSSGQSEILAPAMTVTGDGQFYVPIDWKLQEDQTIEVRVRPKLRQIFGDEAVDPDNDDHFYDYLRWIVVTFWCEAIDQPSMQG